MGFKCFIIRLRFYQIRSCLSSSTLYFIQTEALFGISRQFTFALFTVVNNLAGEFKGILWFLQNTHHRFFRHDYEHKPENALKTAAIKDSYPLISAFMTPYPPKGHGGLDSVCLKPVLNIFVIFLYIKTKQSLFSY